MQAYRAASKELLAQAIQELSQGDVRQASEKGWGAAAQIVKATAEDRGWQHTNHYLLSEAVQRMATEMGDDTILSLFLSANALHTNFYEDWLSKDVVEVGLRDVQLLLDKLESSD